MSHTARRRRDFSRRVHDVAERRRREAAGTQCDHRGSASGQADACDPRMSNAALAAYASGAYFAYSAGWVRSWWPWAGVSEQRRNGNAYTSARDTAGGG